MTDGRVESCEGAGIGLKERYETGGIQWQARHWLLKYIAHRCDYAVSANLASNHLADDSLRCSIGPEWTPQPLPEGPDPSATISLQTPSSSGYRSLPATSQGNTSASPTPMEGVSPAEENLVYCKSDIGIVNRNPALRDFESRSDEFANTARAIDVDPGF